MYKLNQYLGTYICDDHTLTLLNFNVCMAHNYSIYKINIISHVLNIKYYTINVIYILYIHFIHLWTNYKCIVIVD